MNPRLAVFLLVAALAALCVSILNGCGEPAIKEPPVSERGKGPSAGSLPEGASQAVIDENK